MIDVFLCTAAKPEDGLRNGFAQACLHRWLDEDGARVHVIATEDAQMAEIDGVKVLPRVGFQRERRIFADNTAMEDEDGEGVIYVVADDDCLPTREPFLRACVSTMKQHADFGILSLMPVNCNIVRWTNAPPRGKILGEHLTVMEHESVGGIRFCRKGKLAQWPPLNGKGYDHTHCEALRYAGSVVGYFQWHGMLHLGEGYSTVW
jgi:hypothetical protein